MTTPKTQKSPVLWRKPNKSNRGAGQRPASPTGNPDDLPHFTIRQNRQIPAGRVKLTPEHNKALFGNIGLSSGSLGEARATHRPSCQRTTNNDRLYNRNFYGQRGRDNVLGKKGRPAGGTNHDNPAC